MNGHLLWLPTWPFGSVSAASMGGVVMEKRAWFAILVACRALISPSRSSPGFIRAPGAQWRCRKSIPNAEMGLILVEG